jgi:prolyl-tRNA synthetase
VPGYASPIGLRDIVVVVDDIIAESPNLVAGANEEGYHLLNTNYGRDYTATVVADIAVARAGDACPVCGAPLRTSDGVEVGNIFKLGTDFSAPMGATFLDAEGKSRPVIMGSYGIGLGRLLACVVEEHHDDKGIIWPISIAPYQVHLVALANERSAAAATADQLYADLTAAGVEVLYDDRAESPGVKFMDADLIGIPLRLTVGERGLKRGGVELKRRDSAESTLVPVADVPAAVRAEIARLEEAVAARVESVPFNG